MKNILVVGLGNPGDEYAGTRHNLGIDVVRAWIEDNRVAGAGIREWKEMPDVHAEIASVALPEAKVVCLFPLTFMNDSGQAVAAFMRWSKISVEDVIVVHDDLELGFGDVKTQADGSAHGHNGLRSIFDHLGTQTFTRLRIGIGRPRENQTVSYYVLQKFSKAEQDEIQASVISNAVQELTHLVGERLGS